MPQHYKDEFQRRALSIAAEQARKRKIDADTKSARQGRKETEEERRKRLKAARKARQSQEGKLPGGGA